MRGLWMEKNQQESCRELGLLARCADIIMNIRRTLDKNVLLLLFGGLLLFLTVTDSRSLSSLSRENTNRLSL